MHEPLQDFDFKSSQYERPQCGWVCGRAVDGAPCAIGPNRKGRCGTVTTCTPTRVGDRYECARPATQGGRCDAGPLPDGSCCQKDESCQPRRSLQSRRKLVVIWVSVLAFGYCLWSFGSGTPTEAISPGEITFQHRSSVSDCSTCHTAAEGGFQAWVKCAFDSETAIADSRKCLKCHHELGNDAFAAHGFNRARLVSLTGKADDEGEHSVPLRQRLAKLSNLAATDHRNRDLACATCHHEHRGKGFDLKAMSNDQCSTCHTRQFRDFGHGHPEFTNFPYQRRSRIYFDHARHMNAYFPETAAGDKKSQSMTFDCAACHAPDKAGRRMQTLGFERSCAKCHEPQIRDPEFRGVPFVQLPLISSKALAEKNIHIGEWPEPGLGKQIAELPPLMKMLLQSDPEYRAAIEVLGTRDLRSLDPDGTAEEKEAITRLFWSIKRLFYDVESNSEFALRRRLGPRGRMIPGDSGIALKMITAGRRWFPKLADEMKTHAAGNRVQPEKINAGAPAIPPKGGKPQHGPGWYFRDGDYSIRYRPVGHSDPVLKALLDAGANEWYENGRLNRKQSAFEALFLTLANPSASGGAGTNGPVASGRCMSCHSVDVAQNGGVQINWKSGWQKSVHRRLTKFSHAPHVKTLLGSKGCAECHRFEKGGSENIYRSEFFTFQPKSNSWKIQTDCKSPCTSGFEPTQRAVCVKCHTGQAVGDSCLKCHNYHGHRLNR